VFFFVASCIEFHRLLACKSTECGSQGRGSAVDDRRGGHWGPLTYLSYHPLPS
jgi:hypothetical protein